VTNGKQGGDSEPMTENRVIGDRENRPGTADHGAYRATAARKRVA